MKFLIPLLVVIATSDAFFLGSGTTTTTTTTESPTTTTTKTSTHDNHDDSNDDGFEDLAKLLVKVLEKMESSNHHQPSSYLKARRINYKPVTTTRTTTKASMITHKIKFDVLVKLLVKVLNTQKPQPINSYQPVTHQPQQINSYQPVTQKPVSYQPPQPTNIYKPQSQPIDSFISSYKNDHTFPVKSNEGYHH